MTVLMIADLRFKAGAADDVLTAMATQLVDTRAFDGCQEVKVYRGQEDADRVVLVEQWDAPANHQAYMAWRMETGALAALADVLAAEPTFTYFDLQPNV